MCLGSGLGDDGVSRVSVTEMMVCLGLVREMREMMVCLGLGR